jgi:hypothetical protein
VPPARDEEGSVQRALKVSDVTQVYSCNFKGSRVTDINEASEEAVSLDWLGPFGRSNQHVSVRPD